MSFTYFILQIITNVKYYRKYNSIIDGENFEKLRFLNLLDGSKYEIRNLPEAMVPIVSTQNPI